MTKPVPAPAPDSGKLCRCLVEMRDRLDAARDTQRAADAAVRDALTSWSEAVLGASVLVADGGARCFLVDGRLVSLKGDKQGGFATVTIVPATTPEKV